MVIKLILDSMFPRFKVGKNERKIGTSDQKDNLGHHLQTSMNTGGHSIDTKSNSLQSHPP